MSWNVKKAGKGLDVAPEVGKCVEKALHGLTEDSARVLEAHGKAMTSFAEANPEQTIIVHSHGHIDTAGGSASLILERVY